MQRELRIFFFSWKKEYVDVFLLTSKFFPVKKFITHVQNVRRTCQNVFPQKKNSREDQMKRP